MGVYNLPRWDLGSLVFFTPHLEAFVDICSGTRIVRSTGFDAVRLRTIFRETEALCTQQIAMILCSTRISL